MNKKRVIKIATVAFWAFLLLVQVAPIAQAAVSNSLYPDSVGLPGNRSTDIKELVRNVIVDLLLPIAGIIAVLFIIIGGYQYITSGGNEEQAESGKKTLQNAVIGLIIIILSYVIINVVITSIGRVT